MITEEQSLFKVLFHQENPKNNLNAFLYQNSKLTNLLANTKPSYDEKGLYLILSPQKKSYKLKIVYDSIDEKEECPKYDFRVALKPINLVIEENL